MPPRTTIWPLEPHTRGKHLVLENYLQAWLPIMTKWNERVLFIDGFAGPGEYTKGEPGSPVIALRALIDHNFRPRMRNQIVFQFIEMNRRRSDRLKGVLDRLRKDLPLNCTYSVVNSTFDETLTNALDRSDQLRGGHLPPAFVMIDPFGVSGVPMNTIGRILGNPKSEVFVSFMARDINRFKQHPNFERHLNELFGCSDWRRGFNIDDSKSRTEFFYVLYTAQLRRNGAKYVLHFELYEDGQLVYAIFFATNNLEGCDKMKQAIWKIAPLGNYRFKGSSADQFTLGTSFVDFNPLKDALLRRFPGNEWQRIEAVEAFVKSDETPFHTSQLRREALVPMEKSERVEVKEGTRKQKGRYPPGTMLRFVNEPRRGELTAKQLSF